IGKAHERAGDSEGMRRCYERAKQAGRAVGVKNLGDEDRKNLFDIVHWLGTTAMAQGQIDDALDSFKFYTQYERAGLETYRTLAELNEQHSRLSPADHERDIWMALHCTEHALTYDGKDKDLLARKD